MTDIPDDIRNTAERIVLDIDADWTWDGQCHFGEAVLDAIKAIAEALLAERERRSPAKAE